MKGIVFTEFLDMVDEQFGPDLTEDLIAKSDLPSGGIYTSVGTYDHAEIVELVQNLSKATNSSISDLLKFFGTYLLGRFYVLFPSFFDEKQDVMDFLESVDGYIHNEVRKLYPDATLPRISTERGENGSLILTYQSERMMGDLAEGLIAGAVEHFSNSHVCSREDQDQRESSQCVIFTLTPRKPS
jgi:hypothetical protein